MQIRDLAGQTRPSRMQRDSPLGLTITSKRCCVYKRTLNDAQMTARGKNAVAEFLTRKLIVPKIFFDAAWPSKRSRVDVLAVDRAGAGDVYIAHVTISNKLLVDAVEQLLKSQPGHYKYLALIAGRGNYRPTESSLYSPDGLGRVGVLLVEELPDSRMIAREIVTAERFRVQPELIRQLDKFTARQPADIEVRV